MKNYYCINCNHEFPVEGATLKPEIGSMILMVTIGLLAAAAGVGLLLLTLITDWLSDEVRGKFMMYGAAAIGLGLLFAGLVKSVGKGVYAYCPACKLPRGMSSDSPDAKLARRKAGKAGK